MMRHSRLFLLPRVQLGTHRFDHICFCSQVNLVPSCQEVRFFRRYLTAVAHPFNDLYLVRGDQFIQVIPYPLYWYDNLVDNHFSILIQSDRLYELSREQVNHAVCPPARCTDNRNSKRLLQA